MSTLPSIVISPGGRSQRIPPVIELSPVTISFSFEGVAMFADNLYFAGGIPFVFQLMLRGMICPAARLRNWAAIVLDEAFVAFTKSQKPSGKVPVLATGTLTIIVLDTDNSLFQVTQIVLLPS